MMSSTRMIKRLKQSFFHSDNGVEKAVEVIADDESIEKETLPYILDTLTVELEEMARIELKETDAIRSKALMELRNLIEKERNLKTPTDDLFLLAFLRSRKFNVRKSFRILQNYWRFRREHESIYDNSDPEVVKQLILRNFIGYLSYRDKKGCVVLVFKVGLWNPEQDVYENMFRAITAVLIHSILYPATQIAGYRIILDFRGLSWAQFKMCTPANVKLLVRSTQYCFPARYKGFHILAENKLFNLAWAIIYPLLTSKLKKRVIIHGNDFKALPEWIDKSVLPIEYGGEAPEFENSKWAEVMDESTDQVLNMLNYGYKD